MNFPNEVPQYAKANQKNKQFIGDKVEEKKLKVEEELDHSSSTFKAYSRYVSKLPLKVL